MRDAPSRLLWFLLGALVVGVLGSCAISQSISLGDVIGWFL